MRFELLYRLDQLLLFDPFSGDQLNRFAKLPMKSLEEKSHSSLYFAFLSLFDVRAKKVFLLLMLPQILFLKHCGLVLNGAYVIYLFLFLFLFSL